MINGYVNVPEELCDLNKFGTEYVVIPGVHHRLIEALKLNKPFIGKFAYSGVTAVYNPTLYEIAGTVTMSMKLGPVEVSVAVNSADEVTLKAL